MYHKRMSQNISFLFCLVDQLLEFFDKLREAICEVLADKTILTLNL